MAEFDLFELTGLPFDPPENLPKKVKIAIDKKLKELGTSLGSSTQQIERDEKKSQIDFLNGIAGKIFSTDGKKLNDSEYQPLVSQRVNAELKRLRSTATLMAQTGSLQISDGTVKFHRRERKLSEEHVREVFESLGFSIVTIDPLGAFPKFPTNAERTFSEIMALSRTKDPNPNGADTSLVKDLYSFAAYLCGEPENVALYRIKDTSELATLFDTHARKFAMRNDDLGKLCNSLATAAKRYVFDSDEHRQAYEDFLKYKSSSLTELFESIRGADGNDLHNARFAEPCIKRISSVFGNYEVSLAIYNKEAGLKDDPYVPPKPVYHVRCDYCGQISEFTSESEAQQINQCANCKKELFKKCGKCEKLIPVSKEKCPHCGFVFAGAVLFEKYYRAAEDAFRRSDFESARKHLYDAQSADPGETQRVNQLTAKIDAEEKKYAKPINKLRELITGKCFSDAEKALYETIRQYPDLNVTAFETQIRTAMSQANARFEASRKLPASRQADECVAILRECVDHQAAADFLRSHPPQPCKSLSVAADTRNGGISVNWTGSGEAGVEYRLERAAGRSNVGGQVLQDQAAIVSHRDASAKPGQAYTYTVYAVRFGVDSAPVSKTIALYADVTDFRVAQDHNYIRLTWDAPEGSVGARITKITDGKNSVLSQAAYGSLEDKDVQFGTAYTYRIQANYPDSGISPGVEQVITPLLTIDSFGIKAAPVKGDIFKVSWDIRQPGVDLRILANGKLALECKSNSGSAQIKLPMNAFCTISVMAYSGGSWVNSTNAVDVNTYTACGIDKESTELTEKSVSTPQGVWCSLNIKIRMAEPIPGNVKGFYYAVRTASDESRWASVSDIGKAPDIRRISIDDYNDKKEIIYTEAVKDEAAFYISIFTVYAVGSKEVVSDPKMLRLDRPVFADLFWKVSKGLFGGMKLVLDISGNRSIDHIPELVLCACSENEFLTSQDDPRAIVLQQFSSVELDGPRKQVSWTYDIECNYSGKELKRMKFFLFETAPTRSEKFTLRWQQGFKGKV